MIRLPVLSLASTAPTTKVPVWSVTAACSVQAAEKGSATLAAAPAPSSSGPASSTLSAVASGASGTPRFTCVSDSVASDHAVPYGTTTTWGAFRCAVEPSGVTCTDAATGHGFSVSRSAYGFV